MEDSKGHLWIGTDAGLNLLNRKTGTFQRFQYVEEDPMSLSDNTVRAIYEDSDANLWVGTFDGLAKFNPEQKNFTSYRSQANDSTSLSHNVVLTILESKDIAYG